MKKELFKDIEKKNTQLILVHFATTASYLWDVLIKTNKPIYIYVHGYDIIWNRNDDNGNILHSDEYIQNVRNISIFNNVKFIVSSSYSKNCLFDIGIKESKICYKIFGVHYPVKSISYNQKEELNVLFLGRFEDFKGPDIVVSAFILACERGFKGTLTLAGDGPLFTTCKLLSARSNYHHKIKFVGAVTNEQAKILFASSDIYTMHSCKGLISNAFETFGVTYIEAMSYGLPIVTGNYGGHLDYIQHNENAIVVESNSISQHANAFLNLRDNTIRSYLGMNGRKKIIEQFNSDIEKQQLLGLLEIYDH